VLGRQALRTVDTVALGPGRERWILNRYTFEILADGILPDRLARRINPTVKRFETVCVRYVGGRGCWRTRGRLERLWLDHFTGVRGLPEMGNMKNAKGL
jgi:hypothetical protein